MLFLLTAFCLGGNSVSSHAQDCPPNIDFETGTNTIEVYISFLRNKIDKDFEQKLIHTRPGFGYFIKDLKA